MDDRIKNCPRLTERDIALLHKIESGLPITADVSRADVLLCCLLDERQILVARHAVPNSISSVYRADATGRVFTPEDQPLVYRSLTEDRQGTRTKQVLSSGAPVIQKVYPIHNAADRVIGAMLVETNMIEFERHRRRDKPFRKGVRWLQEMAVRGEIENAESLSRFGPLDGIYMVDENQCISYMSGIATNLYRSIGIVTDMRGQPVSNLEQLDKDLVEQAFQAHRCIELRHESDDGRVWVRSVIPLQASPHSWQRIRRRMPWLSMNSPERHQHVDGALVLVHNATEAVQKERELNVKSAMIQEVHHRVKNNLQTIAAILRIQARRCESQEAKQHLTDAVNRILSMSVIHEFLSQDEHRPINIKDVCQRVVTQAQQVAVNPGQHISIEIMGPNIRLPAGQATAAALVVNELLLNALEHGFKGRQTGKIVIKLADLADTVQILIADDGNGLPVDFSLEHPPSLGLQITRTLVTDDLKGTLEMCSLDAVTSQEIAMVNGTPDMAAEDADTEAGPAPATGTIAEITFPKRALNVS
jgi:two-component sensor histidine kinase